MWKRFNKVFGMTLALAVLLTASLVEARTFFVIATGGTGGAYYPLGGVLAQALSDKVPDVIVTAQAGNASVQNCNLIGARQVESAFVQSNIAYNAYQGVEQFAGKPVKNLRAIASLYPETIQIVARAEAGIRTIADIKGKRLIPGDRGSGTEVDTKNVLAALGLTYADFAGTDFLGFSGAAQRLKDKQTDVTFNTAGFPTAAIVELATTTDVVLVPLDDKTIADLVKTHPFYARVNIPAGTYKGVTRAVPTITTMALWVVDANVSDDVVYRLTNALWEKGKFALRKGAGDAADIAPSGAEIMAQFHAQGKNVTLATAMDGIAIPFHPGAAKFYREKGMIK
ncbi:MAG: TAXI family TRAP transporter solute-binding subunit [Smithellaceae bacterium]|nr:TAXI family TRAP transporter solute-binding subunit [Smithellaceae bacterium]